MSHAIRSIILRSYGIMYFHTISSICIPFMIIFNIILFFNVKLLSSFMFVQFEAQISTKHTFLCKIHVRIVEFEPLMRGILLVSIHII